MRKQCYCGKGFELHYRNRKQLLHGFDLFCSGKCLNWYLVNHNCGYLSTVIENHPMVYPSEMDQPFDYYCPVTKRFYRAKGEATFAIWCNQLGIVWEYEPYTIRFTSRKTYNPDFYLPRFGHFIEVKGAWAGSAKKKLKLMVENKFNILLIPDYLTRILEKENNAAKRQSNNRRRLTRQNNN